MHNGSLRIARALAFAVALATLAAIAFLSNEAWRDMVRFREEGQLAVRAARVNARLLGWVRDAETGQRGYLLTGRPEYLEPYRIALDGITADLKELRALLSNDVFLARDAESLRRVEGLEQMIEAKMAELHTTIETRDARGQAAAISLVESNRGKQLMDDIRAASKEIESATDRQVDRSRVEFARVTSNARAAALGGAGVLSFILLLFYWLNERYSRKSEELIVQVDAGRELLRTTLYSIAEGVIATDARGSIQMLNPAAERLTGTTEAQARGKLVEDVFQPAAPQTGRSICNPVREVLETGTARMAGPPIQLGSGPLVEAVAAPIRTTGGDLNGSVLVFRDVGARLESERRLRQTAKLESLGVLAGGIAHDFNNLLVGIVGSASLLEEYVPHGGAGHDILKTLQSAADRASRLTNQLLAYSGRGAFMVRLTDLSVEVQEIAALARTSVPRNIELRLETAQGLPRIQADPSQLHQLVMNLIVNAAEAIGANPGSVQVVTSLAKVGAGAVKDVMGDDLREQEYVVLAVRDTGHGMDEATRARIFDPFFTTKFTGRGLGLAAALGIVKGHGGAIEVQSAPGEGATFRVYFPPAAPARDPVDNTTGARAR